MCEVKIQEGARLDEFEIDGDVNSYKRQTSDLEVELNSLMEALRQRRENAGIYQQILATTASTHQALASTFRSGMTTEEVTSLCSAKSHELRHLIRANFGR